MELKEIVSQFALEGQVDQIKPLGTGLINDTFRVTTVEPTAPDYVLQRINHVVFTDVEMLQQNIQRVTEHIRHKLHERGENDIERKTLRLIPTRDGKLYLVDEGKYWRITRYIPRSITFEQVTPLLAYRTGKAFGEFQYLLSDLPGEPLGATVPNFHNMPFRLSQLSETIQQDAAGRLAEVRPIVDELLSRADDMCRAEHLHDEGLLPRRITHCDTKVSNVLFDEDGGFLCVIDLDTTMPGYVLSDFGDFIRTAANTGAEDDEDPSRVGVNMEIFKEFARGYIESARPFLCQTEIDNLPYGAQLLTYMQTVRFLTDYLNGDTYYKITDPKHNLRRTVAQLALLHSIDAHMDEMNRYIKELTK